MDNQIDIEKVPAKRGRPKGSGGNTRKDLCWSGNMEMSPGVRNLVLQNALECMELPPIDIDNKRQVAERIDWYFNRCCADEIKPTVTGVCLALGIDRTTFYQRSYSNNNPEKNIFAKVRLTLENLWESFMMDGKINPVVGIFLGKNHFGYADKQDIIVTPNNPLGDARDPEEVRQRYLDSVVSE